MSDKDFKSRTVQAVGWGMSSQVASQAFSFCFGIILARLLVPDDFGLIAMVLVFSGFAYLLSDIGLGSALIQKKDATPDHFNSVFWVNLLLGGIMTVLLFTVSPWLSNFYERPELEAVCQVLSLNYIISALALVPRTRLVKELHLKHIALIDFFAMTAAGIIAVYMAFDGYGYWSLVIHRLVQPIVATLLIWCVNGWRPTGWVNPVALRELIGFSSSVFATRVLNYSATNVDKLILGKVLGATSLGLYDKAISMMLFPLQNISHTIGKVMFPALSIIQEDKERVKSVYLRSTAAIALLTFPMMTGMFVVSEAFVLGLLGEQWVEVVPILKIFCIAGVVRSIVTVTGSLYQSQGAAGLQLRVNLFMKPITVIGIVAGLPWGVLGVTIGSTVATIINSTISLTIAGGLIDLRLFAFIRSLAPILFCSIVMAVLVWCVRPLLGLENELALFFLQLFAGVVIYWLCLVVVKPKVYLELSEMAFRKLGLFPGSR